MPLSYFPKVASSAPPQALRRCLTADYQLSSRPHFLLMNVTETSHRKPVEELTMA
jgi:hypothetical protein